MSCVTASDQCERRMDSEFQWLKAIKMRPGPDEGGERGGGTRRERVDRLKNRNAHVRIRRSVRRERRQIGTGYRGRGGVSVHQSRASPGKIKWVQIFRNSSTGRYCGFLSRLPVLGAA